MLDRGRPGRPGRWIKPAGPALGTGKLRAPWPVHAPVA